jgi:DNA-directed RNA polymerase subunit delta
MSLPSGLRPDMLVTDLAYVLLKNRGKAMHFKELIGEIITIKGLKQENAGRLVAQILTEIGMDSRFVHQGNGEWGLRDWQQKGGMRVVKVEQPKAAARRGRRRLDEEFEAEEDIEEEETEEDEDETEYEEELEDEE